MLGLSLWGAVTRAGHSLTCGVGVGEGGARKAGRKERRARKEGMMGE